MPRRVKQKLTRTPGKSKAKIPGKLSEEKWANMKPYGSFVVPDPRDEDSEGYKFDRDDIVAVLPNGCDPNETVEMSDYWIAKIKEVRAIVHSDGSNLVWARVQWFYSGKDVADVIKSFDESAIAPYERIFSDHYDFIEPESLETKIKMIKFNENDPEQAFIARNEYYLRYTLDYNLRTLKPKPGSTTCLCSRPYDPNDVDPLNVMHFCPRPSCRRAYHQKCLVNAKSKESSSTNIVVIPESSPAKSSGRATKNSQNPAASETMKIRKEPHEPEEIISARALRLLACSPDTDDVVDLESHIPLTVIHTTVQADSDSDTEPAKKKKKRGRPSKIKVSHGTQEAQLTRPQSLHDRLNELPGDLLQTAIQPLVRGGAFVGGGVSGNISFVTRARRIVYQALEGTQVPDNWETSIFGEDNETDIDNAIVRIRGSRKPVPPVVCPNCKSAI